MGAQEHRRLKRIKEDVIARDGTVCCYCGINLSLEDITMEHIVPDSKRGTFNSTNLTVSCGPCNNKRGNQPFFEYCKKFGWSSKKLDKYRSLYFNNLKIKVLNIAKETHLNASHAIPNHLINQACKTLKIKNINFTSYEKKYQFDINFSESCERKKIKSCFEQLIKIIESDVI